MKVLLVDDESYMTEYLKKLVDWKSYGFEEVLTASGGSIARDLIEQKKAGTSGDRYPHAARVRAGSGEVY